MYLHNFLDGSENWLTRTNSTQFGLVFLLPSMAPPFGYCLTCLTPSVAHPFASPVLQVELFLQGHVPRNFCTVAEGGQMETLTNKGKAARQCSEKTTPRLQRTLSNPQIFVSLWAEFSDIYIFRHFCQGGHLCWLSCLCLLWYVKSNMIYCHKFCSFQIHVLRWHSWWGCKAFASRSNDTFSTADDGDFCVCVCVCPIRGWAKQWQDFSRYWKMHSNLPSCALSKWSKWLGFPVFHTGPYVETQTKLLSGTTSIIRQGPGELRS